MVCCMSSSSQFFHRSSSCPAVSIMTRIEPWHSVGTVLPCTCTSAQIAQHHQRKGKKAGRIPPFIDDLLHSLKRQNGATTIELGTVWVTSHLFQYYSYITNQRTHSSIPAFQHHPNGNTMLQALEWMMNKLVYIISRERGRKVK